MTETASRPRPIFIRIISILTMVAGLILITAGAVTWATVTSQLSAEKITTPADASMPNQKVNGPLTAYAMAQVIDKHSLELAGGKTYAELDRNNPTRATVATGAFLRASLFTSVVAYGVAAMAMGLGVLVILLGAGFWSISRFLTPATAATAGAPAIGRTRQTQLDLDLTPAAPAPSTEPVASAPN